MQELEAKCAEAAAEVESIAAQACYRQQTKKLTAFKGIKTLIALSFVTDIGDFRRFANARQFMAYLGLVPSERSSGNKRRQGGITKAGNSHLRRRLNRKYSHMLLRGKRSQVAVTAVSRELAGFLWGAMTDQVA